MFKGRRRYRKRRRSGAGCCVILFLLGTIAAVIAGTGREVRPLTARDIASQLLKHPDTDPIIRIAGFHFPVTGVEIVEGSHNTVTFTTDFKPPEDDTTVFLSGRALGMRFSLNENNQEFATHLYRLIDEVHVLRAKLEARCQK